MNLVITVTIISNIYKYKLPYMELHTVVTSDVLTTVSQSAIYNFTTCLTQIPTYLVLPVYYLILHQVKSTKFYNVCCCIDMTNDEQT